MAAAVKTTDAKTRSLELAQAQGHTACSYSARTVGWHLDERGQLVSLALAIHSAHSDAVYAVGYQAASDDATCACQAASYGRPCWHRGVALMCGRAVAALYSPAGRAENVRAFWRSFACEGR